MRMAQVIVLYNINMFLQKHDYKPNKDNVDAGEDHVVNHRPLESHTL